MLSSIPAEQQETGKKVREPATDFWKELLWSSFCKENTGKKYLSQGLFFVVRGSSHDKKQSLAVHSVGSRVEYKLHHD